jgi:hypothetical protein
MDLATLRDESFHVECRMKKLSLTKLGLTESRVLAWRRTPDDEREA